MEKIKGKDQETLASLFEIKQWWTNIGNQKTLVNQYKYEETVGCLMNEFGIAHLWSGHT